MKSNYDILGNHIRLIDTRNRESITDRVLGINIDKFFMPSVANVIGTDLSKYKLMNRQEIFEWVKATYGTEPDYPWNDWNAVLRHKDNNKWYGVVMEVAESKLGLTGDKIVDNRAKKGGSDDE